MRYRAELTGVDHFYSAGSEDEAVRVAHEISKDYGLHLYDVVGLDEDGEEVGSVLGEDDD